MSGNPQDEQKVVYYGRRVIGLQMEEGAWVLVFHLSCVRGETVTIWYKGR